MRKESKIKNRCESYRGSRLAVGSPGQPDVRTWAVAVVKSNFFLFFSDKDNNRQIDRSDEKKTQRSPAGVWYRMLPTGASFRFEQWRSSLARSMFCCASGGRYRLNVNTAGSKQMIPHCMRRSFRVALVRVDHTLRLQKKKPAGSNGQQIMHVSRLAESA